MILDYSYSKTKKVLSISYIKDNGSSVVLNNDNLFLDDTSLAQFREAYAGKVELAKGARELLHLLLES